MLAATVTCVTENASWWLVLATLAVGYATGGGSVALGFYFSSKNLAEREARKHEGRI